MNEKKTLHITVADTRATYQKRDGKIVCGNKQKYQIAFTFDSEWDAYETKTARFVWRGRPQDVVFTGNTCDVPSIYGTDRVLVGVYAGDLLTTTPAEIECELSILCHGGLPADPPADVYAQLMELLNAGGGGGGGGDLSDLEERVETMEQELADLTYKEIAYTSASVSPSTAEIGSTVASVALSWGLNKTPVSQTANGASVAAGARSKTVTGAWKENTSFALTATDERGKKATRSVTLSFLNGVYYGVADDTTNWKALLAGLTKTLRGGKLPSFTVNAGEGQYIWYAVPSRFGACSFKVGGFDGGFTGVVSYAYTNPSGYGEAYDIYRSDNAALGETTVTVS